MLKIGVFQEIAFGAIPYLYGFQMMQKKLYVWAPSNNSSNLQAPKLQICIEKT
jgi:hypothetical protein